ncbi:SAM-dependent methyltransferase [Streptacidiphilus melanogenes]|uniref:SAM-dependent methyltransferase n=1 Tax=Streptacidiphilus melanogenes TaxID=411235 RepID=UPI0005A74E13|nr:SAM-dependent methyltransferase [Streptacidiphilus melanogenes]
MEDTGPPSGNGPPRPRIACVYDYFLGGKCNIDADRQAARAIAEAMPDLPDVLRANRAFVGRAVRALADAGIRQFLDLGSGLAVNGAVHEITADMGVDARVVCVDNDPVVTAYNRRRVPRRGVAVVHADLRDLDAVLSAPESALLDRTRPVAVLMTAVLHFVPHADDPAAVVARYRDALAPGSCIVLSHAEDNRRLPGTYQAARLYSKDIAPIHLRTRTEIAAMLAGLDLLAPGLVPIPDWRPDAGARPSTAPSYGFAAVGRTDRQR